MVRIVAGGDTITATNNHPFYLPQLGKYLRADSLRQNMKLLALTGALLTVHAVEAFDTTLQVYNFEVEEYHNYFVGEEGVLVHNDCVLVKAGLRQVDDQGAAVFDRFDEAFATLPLVERQILKEQFRAYLESANDDLLAFFRGTGYVGDLPLAEVQVQRVGAWGVLRNANATDAVKTNVVYLGNVASYLEKATNFTPQQNALLVYYKADGTHFMTNAASFPDLNTGLANQKTFRYRFNSGPNAGSKDVYAKIGLSDDGYLVGNIVKSTGMNNAGVTSVTEDAMDMALKHFGGIGEVRGVKALWVQNPSLYPDLPDNKSINLLMFEEALETMPPSEAAFQTVTGNYARKRVFTDVVEIRELTEAIDGVNGYEVTFRLPN